MHRVKLMEKRLSDREMPHNFSEKSTPCQASSQTSSCPSLPLSLLSRTHKPSCHPTVPFFTSRAHSGPRPWALKPPLPRSALSSSHKYAQALVPQQLRCALPNEPYTVFRPYCRFSTTRYGIRRRSRASSARCWATAARTAARSKSATATRCRTQRLRSRSRWIWTTRSKCWLYSCAHTRARCSWAGTPPAPSSTHSPPSSRTSTASRATAPGRIRLFI